MCVGARACNAVKRLAASVSGAALELVQVVSSPVSTLFTRDEPRLAELLLLKAVRSPVAALITRADVMLEEALPVALVMRRSGVNATAAPALDELPHCSSAPSLHGEADLARLGALVARTLLTLGREAETSRETALASTAWPEGKVAILLLDSTAGASLSLWPGGVAEEDAAR